MRVGAPKGELVEATQVSRPVPPAGVGLAALSWAHFLNDGYVNYLPGVLPVLLTQLNIPLALSGSLMLAVMLAAVLQPVTGVLADRFGGKWFILLGLTLSTLGAGLVGLAPNYVTLIIFLFIAGIGSTMFHPQALSATRSLARHSHGVTLSIFLIGGELGRGVWPVVAGALVAWLGIRGLWWLLLPGLLTLLIIPRSIPGQSMHIHAFKEGALNLWRREVFALVAFVGLRNIAALGVVTFVPILWYQGGGSLVVGASLVTVMLVVGIIGNFLGGLLGDRIGRRRLLVSTSLLSALFLALFLVSSGVVLWLSLALLGIVTFAANPITVLVGQDLFPNNHSMGSGFALGVGLALGAFGVFGAGFLAASAGIKSPLWVMVGLSAVAAFTALMLPEHR